MPRIVFLVMHAGFYVFLVIHSGFYIAFCGILFVKSGGNHSEFKILHCKI